MRPLSLTARLTVLFAAVSTVVLAGLGALILSTVQQHFVRQDDRYLDNKVRLIASIVADAPPDQAGVRLAEALDHQAGFSAEVLRGDGSLLYRSAGAALPAPTSVARAWHRDAQGRDHRLRHVRTTADPAHGPLQITVLLDTAPHTRFLQDFTGRLALYVAASALLIGLLGWLAARRGLAPLRAMAARAREVTAERLDQRMPLQPAPPEIAELAAHLDAMLARLQADFQRLSELSSDIAHELRTPITNLLTQTEVALARPRSAAEYQDVLLSNAEELQRLSRMIGDMLFLARTEHGGGLPEAGTVVLEREVTELFDFYDALAEERGITLALHGQGQVRGDRLMLRRALGNLLSNALRHTPRGATIAVTVADTAGATEVTVRNPGPPIPADALPHLFERFFRAERSRTRGDADGAGLGLAITRAIMLAHGGTLCVASGPAATCFTLRFGA